MVLLMSGGELTAGCWLAEFFDPAGSTPSMPILILRVPRTRREDGGGDDNGIGDADGLNEKMAPPGSGCRYPSRYACLHALAGNGSDLYDFTENHKPIAEARLAQSVSP